jgi:tRNA(Ile2) C34 agmatinyltransferase TiaS
MEYHISECCKADLFFKGNGKGFWCSKCKKEITHTIVAFTKKEIKQLKELRDKYAKGLKG